MTLAYETDLDRVKISVPNIIDKDRFVRRLYTQRHSRLTTEHGEQSAQ